RLARPLDAREQNTLATWIADDSSRPDGSPGHVLHYVIDLGDCFGGKWDPDAAWRRSGHAYHGDLGYMIADFFSLALIERPWDRLTRPPGSIFGYYGHAEFDPDRWHPMYPNPAFLRMSERDAAWLARILARFADEQLAASARVGDYSDREQ